MTFFQAQPHEHLTQAKHRTAEVEWEEFSAGKGSVVRWEKLGKDNHWFDALNNAAAAGHAPVTSFGYDVAGRNTSVTDPLSRVPGLGYDHEGRITSVTREAKPARSRATPTTCRAVSHA